jgi:hypothetical protein
MLKVNVSLLLSAIAETRAFSMPEMNAGTAYLFEMVYKKVSDGSAPRFSELDYNRFEMNDIRALAGIYNDVFAKNENQTRHVINTLDKIMPVCVAVDFA